MSPSFLVRAVLDFLVLAWLCGAVLALAYGFAKPAGL